MTTPQPVHPEVSQLRTQAAAARKHKTRAEAYSSASLVERSLAETEAWVREPLPHERKCYADEGCAGLRCLPSNKFVLVEQYAPSALRQYQTTGEWPEAHEYCVLCNRAHAWYTYYATLGGHGFNYHQASSSSRTWSETPEPDEDPETELSERMAELFADTEAESQ